MNSGRSTHSPLYQRMPNGNVFQHKLLALGVERVGEYQSNFQLVPEIFDCTRPVQYFGKHVHLWMVKRHMSFDFTFSGFQLMCQMIEIMSYLFKET